jgi:plastocyanin
MRRVIAIVVGALMVTALMGVATGAITTVKVRGEQWRPKHRYIGRGDVVRWRNTSTRVHDIKGYGGWRLSEVLSPGESVKKRFRQRGTYKYRCVRHSGIVGGRCQGMCGLVHVVS